MLDKRQHSGILDVRYSRWADCDTDHYLVVAKVRERLAVSKRGAQKMDMERFNVKKLKGILRTVSGYNQKQVCSSGKLRGQWGHQRGMGQY
jgi:hypothetical protein